MTSIRVEKVVITGGRHFADEARITADLAALLPLGLRRVAQGNAKGADALAAAWARRWLRHDGGLAGYPADWDEHGRAAGCLRNVEMLETERPDLVLAYPDPGSRGTWHCVRAAISLRIPVILWHAGVVVTNANIDPAWTIFHAPTPEEVDKRAALLAPPRKGEALDLYGAEMPTLLCAMAGVRVGTGAITRGEATT